jgi:hypothetical protein
MRVGYTLPALEPGTLSDSPITEEKSLTFQDQLTGVTAQAPVSWEEQLRLDVQPYTSTYLAPPRPPRTLDLNALAGAACWGGTAAVPGLHRIQPRPDKGSLSKRCSTCFRICNKRKTRSSPKVWR